MKILHLSNTPLSNAPANLVKCQNLYGHDATLLLFKKSSLQRKHTAGQLWIDLPADEITRLVTEAEVIHCHNYLYEQQIFRSYPHLVEIVKNKPKLVQYHSSRHSVENFETTLKDDTVRKAVVAQYHVRLYPECEFVVPNVLPIFEEPYRPLESRRKLPFITISYAPSNVNCKGWDDKGWSETKPVLDRIERSGAAVSQVMHGVPYEDCMTQKRLADIGIDEIVTGSYHLSALEYMAMGAIAIANPDNLTIEAMRRIVGDDGINSLPLVVANKNNLEATLRSLLRNGKPFIIEQGQKSREWMETFWNPRNHVKLFESIYEKL